VLGTGGRETLDPRMGALSRTKGKGLTTRSNNAKNGKPCQSEKGAEPQVNTKGRRIRGGLRFTGRNEDGKRRRNLPAQGSKGFEETGERRKDGRNSRGGAT